MAHPETLTTENNLAITLLRLGEFAEARVLLEHAVKARSRLLGSDHPDTLEARDSLAWPSSGASA
ncbi:tetratricopeptide repeat protein [Herbidospora cretacea]|uniref:tetratricopeptide repeat protein n=1 Tax=Herbidospora cretacea TaxID=28444 RepID=UPI0007739DC5